MNCPVGNCFKARSLPLRTGIFSPGLFIIMFVLSQASATSKILNDDKQELFQVIDRLTSKNAKLDKATLRLTFHREFQEISRESMYYLTSTVQPGAQCPSVEMRCDTSTGIRSLIVTVNKQLLADVAKDMTVVPLHILQASGYHIFRHLVDGIGEPVAGLCCPS
jgi:hypothetical protein